jgi:hypothetical protein
LARFYPEVALRSRTLGGFGLDVAKAIGFSPKNLTGNQDFDYDFRIETDQDGADELVTPQVAAITIEQEMPPWQLCGHNLVIPWRGSLQLDDLEPMLNEAVTLAAHIEPLR